MAIKTIANPMFDYSSQVHNLRKQYGMQSNADQLANWQARQGLMQQKDTLNQNFNRQFPSFTGGWARRLGSNVQSGLFGQALGQRVGDFNRQLQGVDTAMANQQAQYNTQQALRQAALEQALLNLKNQAIANGLKF